VKPTAILHNKCKELGIKYVRIPKPCLTRWKSLCCTIDAINRIAPTFTKLLEEGAFAGDFEGKIPTANMLNSMRQMLNPLLRIKRVILLLQGDDKPTIQQVIPALHQFCKLSKTNAFKVFNKTMRVFIEYVEDQFRNRIQDYGRKTPQFAIANFLHPHFKGNALNADNKMFLPTLKEMICKKNTTNKEEEKKEEED
jgi:hypothetical protein